MTILEAIILGVVQGLTEFLPISSSGHLVLAEELLGFTTHDVRFIVIVHLGSLIAVLAVYREQIIRIIKGFLLGRISYRNGRWQFTNPDTQRGALLIFATIPAVLVGLWLMGQIEKNFFQPFWVGIFLSITGLFLFCTRLIKPVNGKLNWFRALIIGVAQALAIFPGMSRSGTTIAAGICAGTEKTRAAEFSFLLSIPIIVGAGIMEFGKMFETIPPPTEIVTLVLGAVTSAFSGYIAIRFLLNIIKKGKLYYFAYYCWLLALIVIIFSA